MEIIKQGTLPGETEHTSTCRHCGCQVRFKEKEAQYRSYPKNESAWVVRCPTKGCEKEIYADA